MTTTTEFSVQEQLAFLFQIAGQNNVDPADMRRAFPERPTTNKQVAELATWLSQHIGAMKNTAANLRGTEQSKSINPPVPASSQKVRDGHFAIPAGDLGFTKPHFFRVKAGRKAGVVFLDEQASDDRYPVRGARKAEVLAYLAKNEQKARELYGTLISRCSRCNRTLTDYDNPYFPAYGPECGSK